MVCSINIDETIRKPNVRPPLPPSKRGPITFIVDIEESNGRDLKRNLTRGVNETDDPATPIPAPTPPSNIDVALQNLILSLSVSSDFVFPISIALEPVEVGLSNLIGLGAGIDVEDEDFLTLSNEADLRSPSQINLSSVTVDLTLPTIGIQTTGSVRTDLGVVEVALTAEEFELEVGGDLDIPGVSLTLPTIETESTSDVNLSPVTVDLTLPTIGVQATGNVQRDLGVVEVALTAQEPSITEGISVDSVVTDLTVDIEVDATTVFEPVVVDLSVDIATDAANNVSLDVIEVELGSNLAVEAVTDAELSVDLSVEAPGITRGISAGNVVTDLTVAIETAINLREALDPVAVELSLIDSFNNALNLQTLEAVLSATEALDVGINIQLPDNMVSTPDDASPIP
jgi:hypothetical protein